MTSRPFRYPRAALGALTTVQHLNGQSYRVLTKALNDPEVLYLHTYGRNRVMVGAAGFTAPITKDRLAGEWL